MNDRDPDEQPLLATFDVQKLRRTKDRLNGLIARLIQKRDAVDGALTLIDNPGRGWSGILTTSCAATWDSTPAGCTATSKARVRCRSTRSMILEILQASDRPLGVREILDRVQETFGETLRRTSVSPLLRKMAEAGEVTHARETASWLATDPADGADSSGIDAAE